MQNWRVKLNTQSHGETVVDNVSVMKVSDGYILFCDNHREPLWVFPLSSVQYARRHTE